MFLNKVPQTCFERFHYVPAQLYRVHDTDVRQPRRPGVDTHLVKMHESTRNANSTRYPTVWSTVHSAHPVRTGRHFNEWRGIVLKKERMNGIQLNWYFKVASFALFIICRDRPHDISFWIEFSNPRLMGQKRVVYRIARITGYSAVTREKIGASKQRHRVRLAEEQKAFASGSHAYEGIMEIPAQ